MKVYSFLVAALFGHQCAARATERESVAVPFGPKQCVTVSQSAANSCVISTDCEGLDLSKTEFAFNCVGDDATVRHSFGFGGFDAHEQFDTEVKCDSCEGASAIEVVQQSQRSGSAESSEGKPALTMQSLVKAQEKATPPRPVAPKRKKEEVQRGLISTAVVIKAKSHGSAAATTANEAAWWPSESSSGRSTVEAVRYGPGGCVSTYRNKVGHCVMETDCDQKAISQYEFGLVCVDKTGQPVRHLFGKDSFDAQESFDTLIQCDQCLGLEDIPDGLALNGEVVTMSRQISKLKGMMQDISADVEKLNNQVFRNSPVKMMARPRPNYALTHQSVTRHRQSSPMQPARKFNLRRSHAEQAKQQEEEDDDSADDDGDDGEDDSVNRQSDRPKRRGCVLVSRSPTGSCVLWTDCEEMAANETEFAINCLTDDEETRHSWGVGGFAKNEKFDTQVKCDRCDPPPDTKPPRKKFRRPANEDMVEDDDSPQSRPPIVPAANVQTDARRTQAKTFSQPAANDIDDDAPGSQDEVTVSSTEDAPASQVQNIVQKAPVRANVRRTQAKTSRNHATDAMDDDAPGSQDEVTVSSTEDAPASQVQNIVQKAHVQTNVRRTQAKTSRNRATDAMDDEVTVSSTDDVPSSQAQAPMESDEEQDDTSMRRQMTSKHKDNGMVTVSRSDLPRGNQMQAPIEDATSDEEQDDTSAEEAPVKEMPRKVQGKSSRARAEVMEMPANEEQGQNNVQSENDEDDEAPEQVVSSNAPGQYQSNDEDYKPARMVPSNAPGQYQSNDEDYKPARMVGSARQENSNFQPADEVNSDDSE